MPSTRFAYVQFCNETTCRHVWTRPRTLLIAAGESCGTRKEVVMQDRGVSPVGASDAFGGNKADWSVDSIARDFAALVAIFERQLELVSPTEVETLSHLRKAKQAAERGAKLSQELAELSNSNK
jgi:hypothetical protein